MPRRVRAPWPAPVLSAALQGTTDRFWFQMIAPARGPGNRISTPARAGAAYCAGCSSAGAVSCARTRAWTASLSFRVRSRPQ